ncbi:amino acid ABC transporter substrate-binding protein [Clostridium thermosuccinogenes]|uniref:Amino acid ABC transporter substrate-binding protein n=1 Tax=Clostridium thermosuccinogenes TaxID=84032 RepID=A0A2K2FEP3_9CLOT|nr:cysteine ABC transporter substrate-binding protein [Pseudoclostridium thermosuccinogenes]AUS95284.1 amino acid ABC transporter substrate-binding protein [Pseudoclostridium thermosuccinogenes]PNT97249.1 amino acid ABC transporter substrate-binding protein [Pseudoclostridium thermosuccinogenes]PNT99226.1 amino acid ABC transporter substrate-binding protein [Pseudoclostridium thermosuccinogenes]
MGKNRRIIHLLLIAVLALGMLAGCSNASSKESASEVKGSIAEIKERGKIRIGVFSDKNPFGYVDENGVNQGFDVYIARRFAKDLLGDESKVEFVLVDAASRVAFLESNKVDIIMANFTVTEERKQKVDFANPYMKVSLGIVSPESAPITSIEQLKGKKAIVAKGTTAETFLTENYPEIEQLKFEQYTEIFEALKDGRGDAIVNDNTEVIAWAKQNPGFVVGVPTLGGQDTIAPAVKKGNKELLDWINNELAALGKENFIHKAYDETLADIYGEDFKESLVIEGGKLE